MIVNAYAVLDGFLCLLRAGLGVAVVVLAVGAIRSWTEAGSDDRRTAVEDRGSLLALLTGLLVGLNVAAWPVLYLLLQSYVPEWPGVMCVYGVTRIGTGSLGPSRFLPRLVTALELIKPALVFLGGAWLVLYRLNRRTRTAPLTNRVLVAVLAVGVLAVADAAAEAAYLAIPKAEQFLSAGCCTATVTNDRFLPTVRVSGDDARWLWVGYFTVNGGLLVALGRRRLPRAGLPLVLLADVLALPVNGLFLTEVAAPRLLRMPNHHCPYDLIPAAPAGLLAAVLFLAGGFAVGWAGVVAWLGRHAETEPFRGATVDRLLRLGFLGYLMSVIVLSADLALAGTSGFPAM